MEKRPVLIYVCTRGGFELFKFLETEMPKLAELTKKVSLSVDALKAVPDSGPITVLSSNIFHGFNNEIGIDGELEYRMNGAKLAKFIKKKNSEARVYLYSEVPNDDPILDGIFSRDINAGMPNQKLINFLDDLSKVNI